MNVGRGGTAALIALLVPPILIRKMEPLNYAVWVLILQVISYMGFLDFGLQTAVGRYIAFANEKKDQEMRDGFYSTAFVGLSVASGVGCIVLLVLAAATQWIFPNIPAALMPDMRIAMLIAGISVAVGLPASAWNGVFAGMQRYEIPAFTTTGGKVAIAIGLIFAAYFRQSLILMASILATINLISYASQFVALHRITPEIRLRFNLITGRMIRELSGYCLSLTVWSFSTLLVSGFDLILVGRFEFRAVAVYSASAVLISFLGGVQTAIFNVMMPHAAALYARESAKELSALLLRSTRIGVLLLLLSGLPLIFYSKEILGLWLGAQYAQSGAPILALLVVANMIRLIGVPYSSILVGTGQQRLILLSPLAEGISNLMASLYLGAHLGAIGVAYGTLVGSIVGISLNIFYNLKKTKAYIPATPLRFLEVIGKTACPCTFPLLLMALIPTHLDRYGLAKPAAIASMATVCLMLLLRQRKIVGSAQ